MSFVEPEGEADRPTRWPIALHGEPGFVYFIQGGKDGPIKIGWSIDPNERFKSLQIASPIPLQMLQVIEGGRAHERKLHRELKPHRLKGEWFKDCLDVRDAMRSAKPVPRPISYWPNHCCLNCGAVGMVDGHVFCAPCLEFWEAREGDRDPFDDSIPRDLAA